ncbi:long-chain-fatty-acid--AMP ligase FadD30 [Mycobacterium tuberculosis variant bovis BCG]|nr:long-chain-fatty-acid--AMP ligase FadD30 [Mycobacterium tuberculosis variant bovis BCG]
MSVISTLRDRATTTPSDEAFVFMDYDTKTGDQIDRMTWSQLYSRVTAVSAYLISYGRHADRRRTAAISAPQGLDYVAGFLGALCAGWRRFRYQNRWAAYAISGLDWLYSTVPPTSC